jgi:prepilin-type processing-associated H-X9-DG protein
MRTRLISILAVLFAPSVLIAQPLADRLPDDAEIYVGWNGTISPGPGYDQSHLKAVLDASQLPQFFQDSMPRLFQQVAAQNPQAARQLRQMYGILTALAEHPTAIYFGGLGAVEAGGGPFPKLAIVCDGGTDASKIERQVRILLNNARGAPLNLKLVDTLVILSDFVVPDTVAKPLSQNPDFQAAMGQLGKDPSIAMYVNGPSLVSTIDALINQAAPPQAQQMWPQIRDALGVSGLKAVAATAGFDGKSWSIQTFVNAPAPRKGLLAMGDVPPLSDDLLKLIPASSTIAGAGTCDLNAFFTQIDQAIVQFSPDQGNQFHQILAQVNQTIGFDIQKDFLAALGPQWAYFDDPAIAGDGPLGFAIVNRPRNPDQFQTSMTQLENFFNSIVAQQFHNQHPKITLQFRQASIDGTNVHFLAAPLITPSWAIKDGTLYIGLYPQVVDGAFSRAADSQSIRDNPAFQATMQSLQAPSQFSSFSFVDLPKTMPGSYQACLALVRLYFGLGDLIDMQSPPMILPPLPKLLAETEPAGAVGWSDDAGYHLKTIEPFPGASVIGSAQGVASGSVGETALMASIMLPSLNRARETANRVKCASNLRQIGQAILLYSNDTKGSYPPDLGTLIKTEDVTAEVFVCPDTNTHPPPNMSPDDAADWVNKNSDYIYIGAGLRQGAGRDVVVCYEKDDNHGGDGINVLFGDGHVEFLKLDQAHKFINDSIGQK